MWQWQAEVAALWMVEDSDGSWSCGKLEVENHAWATQWNCMELDDTLAFPPRPHRAEVAVHGWWAGGTEGKRPWPGTSECVLSSSAEEFGWKSLTFDPRSCWIGLGQWRHAGTQGKLCPMAVEESKALLMWRICVWSQLHQLCPGCQACYGSNAGFLQCCSRFMRFSREFSMQASAVFTEWKMVWREHKSAG